VAMPRADTQPRIRPAVRSSASLGRAELVVLDAVQRVTAP
jgi:hypothetical protein